MKYTHHNLLESVCPFESQGGRLGDRQPGTLHRGQLAGSARPALASSEAEAVVFTDRTQFHSLACVSLRARASALPKRKNVSTLA